MAGVAGDIAFRNEIVEPVADELAEQGSDNRREVEEADGFRPKAVEGGEEDGEGGVDAYYPGEGQEVIEGGDEDRRTGDNFYGAHHSLEESVAEVTGLPLFDTNYAE